MPGRRDQDRARRRDPGPRRQHRQGLLQEAGGDRARCSSPDGWFAHRRHRADRRGRLPLHHRPQEGPDRHRGRHEHRAAEHREPAQGRSVHQPGDGPRRPAAVPGGPDHAEPRGAGEVRPRAGDPRHATPPRWRSTRRSSSGSQRTVERARTRSCSPTPRSRSSRSCPADFTVENGAADAHAQGQAQGHHRASTARAARRALPSERGRSTPCGSTAGSPSSRARAAGSGAPWRWRWPRRAPTSRWRRGLGRDLEETARG